MEPETEKKIVVRVCIKCELLFGNADDAWVDFWNWCDECFANSTALERATPVTPEEKAQVAIDQAISWERNKQRALNKKKNSGERSGKKSRKKDDNADDEQTEDLLIFDLD